MAEDTDTADTTDADELTGLTERPVLAPDEIVNYDLERVRKKGYDREQVDDLLDQLAAQTGDLLEQLADATRERDELRDRLAHVSETEKTLKRTLVVAQRAADSSLDEAREQADAIRHRASEHAEALLGRAAENAQEMRDAARRRARAEEAEARRRRRILDEHVTALRAFAEDHQTRIVAHLEQQLERLRAMDVPPAAPPEPSFDEDTINDEETVADADIDQLLAGLVDEVDAEIAEREAADARARVVEGGGDPFADSDEGSSEDADATGDEDDDGDGELGDMLAEVDEAAAAVGATTDALDERHDAGEHDD